MNSTSSPKLRTIHSRRPVALSVIIPFYNEEQVLAHCLERLLKVGNQLGLSYELLFVDDGSSDGGAGFIARQARVDTRIKLVRLSRNFGKEAAMTAGLDQATGDAVVILDADLQDPPELIPKMVDAWHEGAEVVLMQRRSRAGESLLKRSSAYLFYRLLNRISGHRIPADTGDFRLLSRKAVEAIRQLPERNRYMKGLFSWVGMETRVIPYDREARAGGSTKWNYFSLFRLAIEGITSFSVSPLRWATFAGVLAAAFGGAFGIWIVIKAMFLGEIVRGYPSLIALITFLGGIQLLTIGILGEYVGKTYMETKQRPTYLIREIIGKIQTVSMPSAGIRAEAVGDE